MDAPTTEIAINQSPRFSLKAMFLVVTIVAILFAPLTWFGGGYLFSVSLSTALVGACLFAYRRGSPGGAVGWAVMGVVVAFFTAMFSIVFLLHALINIFVCALCFIAKIRFRLFGILVVGVGVGIYAYSLLNGAVRVRELINLRAKYPFESVVERLAFERSGKLASEASSEPIELSSQVAANLEEQEYGDYYWNDRRAWALRELHENINRHFARAAGFGVMRMPTIYAESFVVEPRDDIQLPLRLSDVSAEALDSELDEVHREAASDFLSPDRIGYVRSREEVAGFESHGFIHLDERLRGCEKKPTKWQVTRLELVSLLRNDEPCAYVAEQLPQMDELDDVPHRPLNEFERDALPRLTSEEDLVIDQGADRIRMLGAVRAGNDCLECHEGTRGKLLGAFSYELMPFREETSQPNPDQTARIEN